MARAADRLPENVEGELFVDESCIDCETCRLLAPGIFLRSSRGLSYVARQPASDEEQRRAALALVACPTASIGGAPAADVAIAAKAFPLPIAPGVDDVFFCGYTSADSFGAWSYLLRRPGGNVLVDSPRAARPLFARLAALGGVRTLFLTHRDDVADHRAIARRFGCERILHADDVTSATSDVERRLWGRDPVRLAEDLVVLPVPGHTPGSSALLYRDTYLFSGDHLFADDAGTGLHASRSVCWWSWPEQLRSLERLRAHRFEWLLPGHGAPLRAASPAAMQEALAVLIARYGGG